MKSHPRSADTQVADGQDETPRRKKRGQAAESSTVSRVIAVGGGKGGIGKSLISANLGQALAQLGESVLLVDLDLGGANLHTCLGIPQPRLTLSDFVERRVANLEDVAVDTGVPNLRFVSGALDSMDAANPKHAQKTKLIRQLRQLRSRFIILDLGAGTSLNVLDFFLSADIGLTVLLPEPTSIENAYRFLKSAFLRKLLQLLQIESKANGYAANLDAAIAAASGGNKTPMDVLSLVNAVDSIAAARVEAQLKTFRPKVVVNQVRNDDDREVAYTVVTAWKKFFGLELGFLGNVEFDEAVLLAVRSRSALLGQFPSSAAGLSLTRLAQNLCHDIVNEAL